MPKGRRTAGGAMEVWYFILLAIGLALLVMLWRWSNPPRLEIGERGILDRSLGWGWIPWNEIEGAYPPTADRSETVRLKLRVTDRLARVLRKDKRGSDWDGPPRDSVEIQLDLKDSELNAVEVLQEILSHEGAESKGRETPGQP